MGHCRRIFSSTFLPLLLTAFFICFSGTGQATEGPAGQIKNNATVKPDKPFDLSGAWKLIYFEVRSSKEEKTYPFGDSVKGLLIYTKGGLMSGKLMPSQRPLFASPDPFKGTPAEIKQAFISFVGYYGTYEVNADKGVVRHHVEGSLFPNWEGSVHERFFKLHGNQLTLSTPPMPHGDDISIGVLVWDRIE